MDDALMEIMGYYRRLFQIERSFRMAESDLRVRPIFHSVKQSIDAHLTVVMAGIAVGRWLESVTGSSQRKRVRELRVHRSVELDTAAEIVVLRTVPCRRIWRRLWIKSGISQNRTKASQFREHRRNPAR